ncbi:MAG: hypothetical protein FWC93_07935 [Defluviitaleaceae bacterium]|nr:hypothetical protein [Defluviitaleaceae bacterium]
MKKNVNMLKYLQSVLELEKNVYVLEKAAARIHSQTNYTVTPLNKRSSTPKEPEKVGFGVSVAMALISMFWGVVWGALIGAPIGLVVAWIRTGRLFVGFFTTLFSATGWMHIGIATAIGAGAGIVIGIIFALWGIANNNNKQNFEAAKRKYSSDLAKAKEKYHEELDEKANLLEYSSATRYKLEQTRQTLDKLYGLNIIHPQYRNIVAVASFYQYFDTGRCMMLEGHEGAYNLYENERRMDMIITQLNVVVTQLNKIRNTQYALYEAICEANRRLEDITQDSQLAMSYAKATAENSEIIAYNSHVAAKNTEFLSWMEVWKQL